MADVVFGVTLEQFARVNALLGSGISLEAALQRADVAAPMWKRAAAGWTARMLEDEERSGVLIEAYDAAFIRAQDELGRRLPPFDEDLRAWLDLLRALADQERPLDVIAQRGLSPAEFLRLQRTWGARLAADRALQGAALQIFTEPARAVPMVAASATTAAASKPATSASAAPEPARETAPKATEPRASRPPAFTLAPQPRRFAVPPEPAAPVAPPPVVQGPPISLKGGTFVMTEDAVVPEDGAKRIETVAVDQSAFPSATPPGALPAAPSGQGSGPPSLTMEQYAAMTAELMTSRPAKVYARYGLDDEDVRRAVVGAWEDRLKKNPAEREQWKAIYVALLARMGLK